MENLIITTKEELKKLINEAVREAFTPKAEQTASKPQIKGIKGLAEFLKVSHCKAQTLKNSGVLPYWQDGRLILFDPDKVREAMDKQTAERGQ